jgi:molecular chaperone GrpE
MRPEGQINVTNTDKTQETPKAEPKSKAEAKPVSKPDIKTHNEAKKTGENTTPESTTEGQEAKTDAPTENKVDAATNTEAEQEGISAVEDTPDPIALLEAENTALKDKVLRVNAEMENLRRRTEREKQDMAKFAISNFARDVISVDDNLNRALEAVPDGAVEKDPALKALVDGVEMTGRELANVFERNGIKRVDPKGEIFDPNAHQAMFEMPNPEVPSGTIMEVIATGFMIEGRILRPAMVGIAKGGKKPEKTAKSDGDQPTVGDSSAKTDEQASGTGPKDGPNGDNIDKAV